MSDIGPFQYLRRVPDDYGELRDRELEAYLQGSVTPRLTPKLWTPYNFGFFGSVTNPVVSSNTNKGWYMVSGGVGLFHLALVFNGGDTVGSGGWTFGLPTAWDVDDTGYNNGTAWVIGGSTDRGIAGWRVASRGTSATLLVYLPGTATQMGSGSYAWSAATPDRVEITGMVQLA